MFANYGEHGGHTHRVGLSEQGLALWGEHAIYLGLDCRVLPGERVHGHEEHAHFLFPVYVLCQVGEVVGRRG